MDGVGEGEGVAGAGFEGAGVDREVAVSLREVVGVAAGERGRGGEWVSARVVEARPLVDVPAAFVDELVVAAAEQDEIREGGGATAGPVVEVVGVEEAAVVAAGEAAAAVSGFQGAA